MTVLSVECPRCRTPVGEFSLNQPEAEPCAGCRSPLQVEVFPALFRRTAPPVSGEIILVEGEAACFYHPAKKAVLPCHGCGRFLCALCDCELNGQHFCPACLEAGKTRGRIKSLDHKRTLYDSIALSMAVYPMLIFYFTVITAPMTLFVAIRYWKSPPSLV